MTGAMSTTPHEQAPPESCCFELVCYKGLWRCKEPQMNVKCDSGPRNLSQIPQSSWRSDSSCTASLQEIVSTIRSTKKLHRQETPNSVGGRKSMYQADEVRHYRSCRTFYVDLCRGSQKIFMQELPMSILEEHSNKHQRRGSSRS